MTEPIPIFDRLRARWVLLFVALVIGVGAGVAFDRVRPPQYTASAEAVISPAEDNVAIDASVGIAQAYTRLATDPNVVAEPLEREGIAIPPGDIDQYVRGSASPDAPIIEIFGTRESPEEAARLANAVLDALIAYSEGADGLGYTVEPFAEASTPTDPSGPGLAFHGLLGGGVGLLLGGLLALTLPPTRFARRLDRRLRTAEDVQRALELPVLARIPRRRRSETSVSVFKERYAVLRTNLQFVGEKPPRAIAVTSAGAGEGKTTTAANLALAWADAGHRAIAVEGDFRRPALQRELMPGAGGPLLPGLSNYLVEQASADSIAHSTGKPNVGFVPAGPLPPNPSALLDSQRGKTAVGDFRRLAELIVVDCPPLDAGADASVVSGWVDGVLLVVDLTTSTERAVREAIRQLRTVEASVLGVLLNRDPGIDVEGAYAYDEARLNGSDGRRRRLLKRGGRRRARGAA